MFFVHINETNTTIPVDMERTNSTFNPLVSTNETTTNKTEHVYVPAQLGVDQIILAVFLSLVTLVTIIGNICVLIAVAIDKKLRTPFNCFIVNLAITDVTIAVTAMSFYIIDTVLGWWPFGEVVCGLWILFDFAMTFASVFTLVAISVDRYWSVSWTLHYKRNHTRKKVVTVLSLIWVSVVVVWVPPFISDRIHFSQPNICIWEPSQHKEYVIFVDIVGHYFPCLLMLFCYCKVFVFMRKHRKIAGKTFANAATSQIMSTQASGEGTSRTVHSTSSKDLKVPNVDLKVSAERVDKLMPPVGELARGPNDIATNPIDSAGDITANPVGQANYVGNVPRSGTSVGLSRKEERRIFVTLTYIIFSYLVCWLPFYIVFDISFAKPELIPGWLYTFMFWMTYFNSTLNPFLYAYSSKQFKSTFKKILACKLKKIN